MKRLMLIIVVGMMLFVFVGCNSITYLTIPVSTTPVFTTETTIMQTSLVTETTTEISETTTPIASAIVIKTKDDLKKVGSDLAYPLDIQFPNYLVGVKYSIWLRDDNTAVLGHNSGDVLGIKIYNDHDVPCVFAINYWDGFASPTTYSQISGIVFQAPPIDAVNWVNIKHHEVTLLPYELATIPITFQVPVGTVVPDNWEFDISVTNETFANMITGNVGVRCLVMLQK